MLGYNNVVEMHPYAGGFYREQGAINYEILNFNNKLQDRFTKLNPDHVILENQMTESYIMKVINDVKGLKEYYKLAGSPKFSVDLIHNYGNRGWTSNLLPYSNVYYKGAFKNNFWLASTLFHEFSHTYQNNHFPSMTDREGERQAYSTEWRLGNRDTSIWQQIIGNQTRK